MSLVGFKARNHRQQVLVRGALPKGDERATTLETFAPLHERFRFTIDVAAIERNAKLPRYLTPEDDGLEASWAGERVWCNPPYSDCASWVEKAWAESEAELIVMLLPANRTEQGWWQQMVEPYRDRAGSPLAVEFLPGRIRFIAYDREAVGANERPPFGCVLLVWQRVLRREQRWRSCQSSPITSCGGRWPAGSSVSWTSATEPTRSAGAGLNACGSFS